MTDPIAPLQVNVSPAPAQIAAGIRQVAAILASIALTVGATAWAAKLNMVVALAPQIAQLLTLLAPLVLGGVVWIGQMETRKQAKVVAAIVADPRVPDDVATLK